MNHWIMGRNYSIHFLILLFLLGLFTISSPVSSIQDQDTGFDNTIQIQNEHGDLHHQNIGTDQIELQGTPIRITSDGDFSSQATTNGWPGDGSASNPFVIEGLTIVTNETSTSAIDIQDTDVHFIIRDCILTATDGSGILLNGVSNGTLINNMMSNNAEYGVRIDDFFVPPNTYNMQLINNTAMDNGRTPFSIKGENHTLIGNIAKNTEVGWSGFRISGAGHIIRNNTAIGTGHGIYLQWANNSVVENNFVDDSYFYGIELYETVNISITNNEVTNTGGSAFSFWSANHTLLINNTAQGYYSGYFLSRIYDSLVLNNSALGGDLDGLIIQGDHNEIRGNTVVNNRYGLRMAGSSIANRPGGNHNNITDNVFSNNNEYGMQIANSSSNVIANNTLENNELYGMIIDYSSGYNHIEGNEFISNNYGDVQAFSSNSTNIFDRNYWSDYDSTDEDGDGYGEQPYLIDGAGLCTDEHPVIIITGLPQSPINLMITAGVGNLSLVWEPGDTSDTSIIEYIIYRSGDADENFIEYIRTGDTKYVDTQVTIGVEYFYKITAINEVGESSFSETVSGIPLQENLSTSQTSTSSQDSTTSTSASVVLPSIGLVQVFSVIILVSLTYYHTILKRNRNS